MSTVGLATHEWQWAHELYERFDIVLLPDMDDFRCANYVHCLRQWSARLWRLKTPSRKSPRLQLTGSLRGIFNKIFD